MSPNDVPTSQTVDFLTSLNQISQQEWNALVGGDYPFLRHEFLWGLEDTGCTTAETGWQPHHAILRNGDKLIAVMPMYLKSHSYGEYVFDWSWADAWQQSGLSYYPKLVTAIPFTPATGPRLCCDDSIDNIEAYRAILGAIKELSEERQLSSWHLLFPEVDIGNQLKPLGLQRRTATQFHWFNEGYSSFDDFLVQFSSRKRKNLRRERKRVTEQGISLKTCSGEEISDQDWQQFYHFYQLTYAKRSGHGGYLNKEFFTSTAANMGDQVIMTLAYLDGRAVAGALYFQSGNTLYGRYWGAEREYDCLHFEACYYQGIEYCIANGLQRFDPGAQGEHKIQRGFRPVKTVSLHWIANPELAAAVEDFTRREDIHTDQYIASAKQLLPFKSESPAPNQ